MLLMGISLLTTIVIAIPIGVLAAVKQYSVADKVITVFATDRLRGAVVLARHRC